MDNDENKYLVVLERQMLSNLHSMNETGLGFYIVGSASGYYVVLHDGKTLPLFDFSNHDRSVYSVFDLLNGDPVPQKSKSFRIPRAISSITTRHAAHQQLNKVKILSAYTGTTSSFPLVGYQTLKKNTRFLRYISGGSDAKFNAGRLKAGTYLTSIDEKNISLNGFSAVGRLALPLPLPASTLITYELPKGTNIEVGTIAPLFGQSGGGVEIRLKHSTTAVEISNYQLDDF